MLHIFPIYVTKISIFMKVLSFLLSQLETYCLGWFYRFWENLFSLRRLQLHLRTESLRCNSINFRIIFIEDLEHGSKKENFLTLLRSAKKVFFVNWKKKVRIPKKIPWRLKGKYKTFKISRFYLKINKLILF